MTPKTEGWVAFVLACVFLGMASFVIGYALVVLVWG